MKVSKQAQRDAKSLFTTCKVDGVLDAGRVRQAVSSLLSSKPRGYMGILGYFHRLVRLEVAKRAVTVESSSALSPSTRSSIEQQLAARYGAGLQVAYSENPALIGGLRLQVGSDVYDGSIQARLAALAESF